MKKKISLLGLVLILVFTLAGCGSSASEDSAYDQATMESYAAFITDNFSSMTEEDFQTFRDASELELDLTMLNTGIPVEGETFIGMIDAWVAGQKDCGTITEIGAYEMEISNTGATLIADFTATDRSGNIQFTFDEEMNMESLTINPEYSMSEILAKAGMNTLLGMGTVFVVLIFIAFVISLFKYIPVIQGLFSKKAKTETTVSTPAAAPAAPAVETEETDDTELIAVIAAAIAAAEGTSTDGFVVRSIKRRKTNNWK